MTRVASSPRARAPRTPLPRIADWIPRRLAAVSAAIALTTAAASAFPSEPLAALDALRGAAAWDDRAPSPGARGRTKVDWTRVDVPEGPDAARVEKAVRAALKAAVKRADFGDVRAVTASARVVELTWEDRGDVLRLSCTVVGRLKGGPRAKSHISFGGRPEQRKELEKQVLAMVANGVVTRLAELARHR